MLGSDPNNQQGHPIHDKHHGWHHKDHDPVNKEVVGGGVLVDLIKTIFFKVLIAESPDDHQTGQAFPGNQVQFINQFLDQLEAGHGNSKNDTNNQHHRDHCDEDNPTHRGRPSERHNNPTNGQNRRINQNPNSHNQYCLDLGNIIGVTGNQ